MFWTRTAPEQKPFWYSSLRVKTYQFLGFTITDDGGQMRATGVGNTGKTGQPIGEHGAFWAQRNAGLMKIRSEFVN
jgi:hypothetical protein